ncbi:MAG TPA: glycosyltransferase [Candidatus Paceibacterota bacterium]|nr:glycosyltransferase [Candidatus Paceibacterota bacterium]
MRIGIDARFFGAKDKGLGRYAENLIKNLEVLDNLNQYFVFLKKERWEDYIPKNHNFKKILFSQLKQNDLDLMHFTYFKAPLFYQRKFIVTIHDLITSHVGFFKKIIYKLITWRAIKKSEKIIAVSEYTKQEILKHYKINSEKIKVIYEGVF